MGVNGLWRNLDSIEKSANISQFRGSTVAIDGYAWLHKSVFTCAKELALGVQTTRHIKYFIKRLQLLVSVGVTPYVVFDGDYLPSKADVEKTRKSSRTESFEKAQKFESLGNSREAYKFYQRSVDITPEIVAQLISILIRENVQYVVAPYEADAQLVYLEKNGFVQAIITEDSDLLIFGAQTIIRKMADNGDCSVVSRKDFPRCTNIQLSDFSDEKLRALALFSGCDYSAGIPRIGIKKAHSYLCKYHSPYTALQAIRRDGYEVPSNFETIFEQGDTTFQFQRVYSITECKLVTLNELDLNLTTEAHDYIGKLVPNNIAQGVAKGCLDPMSKTPISIPDAKTVDPNNYLKIRTKALGLNQTRGNCRKSLPLIPSLKSFLSPKSHSPFSPQHFFSNQSVVRADTLNSINSASKLPAGRSASDIIVPATSRISIPLTAPKYRTLHTNKINNTQSKSILEKRATKYLGLDNEEVTDTTEISSQIQNATSQSTIIDSSQSIEMTDDVVSVETENKCDLLDQSKIEVSSKFFKSSKNRSDRNNRHVITGEINNTQRVSIDILYKGNNRSDNNDTKKVLQKFQYESDYRVNDKEINEKAPGSESLNLWNASKGIRFSKTKLSTNHQKTFSKNPSSDPPKIQELKSFAYSNSKNDDLSTAVSSKYPNLSSSRIIGKPKTASYQSDPSSHVFVYMNLENDSHEKDSNSTIMKPKLADFVTKNVESSRSSSSSPSSQSSGSHNYYSGESGSQSSLKSLSPALPTDIKTLPILHFQQSNSKVDVRVVPHKKTKIIPSLDSNSSITKGRALATNIDFEQKGRNSKPNNSTSISVSLLKPRSANRIYFPSQYSQSQNSVSTECDNFDEIDTYESRESGEKDIGISLNSAMSFPKRTAKQAFAETTQAYQVSVKKSQGKSTSGSLYPSPQELEKHRLDLSEWKYIPK